MKKFVYSIIILIGGIAFLVSCGSNRALHNQKNLLEKDILDKKPDIIFVAMGSPAQELLMSEMHVMHSAVYQGLGGSFDVYTGKVQRAPSFFVNHGMEGIYRAIKEPQKRIKGVLSDVWFLIALYLGKY